MVESLANNSSDAGSTPAASIACLFDRSHFLVKVLFYQKVTILFVVENVGEKFLVSDKLSYYYRLERKMLLMKKTEVIKFDELMLPSLEALRLLGGSASVEELNSKVIGLLQLSEDMQNVLHKEGGTQTAIEYRLAWARTYLKKYGLVDNSSRGVWALNNSFDGDIDNLCSSEIKKAVRLMNKSDYRKNDNDGELTSEDMDEIDALLQEAEGWQDKLRNALLKMKPDAFERLTLRILRESGFTQVEVTGKSGDNGIDGKGIIRLHGIMSFHMIFQCKRYKGSVTPSEVRDFRGAMQGRADKGLFITTGSFTSEAKKEATRDGAPALDLIDGDALINKLKDLRLGVTEKVIIDYEVNEEWFANI